MQFTPHINNDIIKCRRIIIGENMNNRIEKVFKLADASVKRFARAKLSWQWGQGLFIYALSMIDSEFTQDKFALYIKQYYDRHIRIGYKINSQFALPAALSALWLYDKTKEIKYRKIGEAGAEYLKSAEKTADGIPYHSGGGIISRLYPESIRTDSIMMCGVFASIYAKYNDDNKIKETVSNLTKLFTKNLLDSDEHLLYHSYLTQIKTRYPLAKILWATDNAMTLWALSVLLENSEEKKEKEYTGELFRNLSGALLKYQRADGYFESVLNIINKTGKESSATMFIACAWFYGYRKGLLSVEYYRAAIRAFNAVTDDFEIKKGLLSMPYISAPAHPLLPPYLVMSRASDRHNGLAAAFLAALEYKRCIDDKAGISNYEIL